MHHTIKTFVYSTLSKCERENTNAHLISAPRPRNGCLIPLGCRHEAAQTLVLGRAVPLEPLATLRRGQPPDLFLVVEAGYVLPHALRTNREPPNPNPAPDGGARVGQLLRQGLVGGGQIGVVCDAAADVEVVAHSAVLADDAEAGGRGRGAEGRRRRRRRRRGRGGGSRRRGRRGGSLVGVDVAVGVGGDGDGRGAGGEERRGGGGGGGGEEEQARGGVGPVVADEEGGGAGEGEGRSAEDARAAEQVGAVRAQGLHARLASRRVAVRRAVGAAVPCRCGRDGIVHCRGLN